MGSSPKTQKRSLFEMNNNNNNKNKEWKTGIVLPFPTKKRDNDVEEDFAENDVPTGFSPDSNLEYHPNHINSKLVCNDNYKFPKIGESPNNNHHHSINAVVPNPFNSESRKVGILAENHIKNRIILQNNFHGLPYRSQSTKNQYLTDDQFFNSFKTTNTTSNISTTTTTTTTSSTNSTTITNLGRKNSKVYLQKHRSLSPKAVISQQDENNNHNNNHNNNTNGDEHQKHISKSIEKVIKRSLSSAIISKFSAKKKEKPLVYAEVLYTYTADSDEELNLIKGDSIIITEQCSDGWWKGRHYLPVEGDKIGIFPKNYVSILPGDPKMQSNISTIAGKGSNSSETLVSSSIVHGDPKIFFVTKTTANIESPQQILSSSFSSSLSSSESDSFLSARACSYSSNSTLSPRHGQLQSNTFSTISGSQSSNIQNQRVYPIQVKIFTPPFLEHTVIQLNNVDTLKDVLERLVIKKELIQDCKCYFKYSTNSDKDPTRDVLPLTTFIDTIKEPKRIGIRLFVEGMDYIDPSEINHSTSSVKLSCFFVLLNNKEKYLLQYDDQSIQIKKNITDSPTRIISLHYTDIETSDKTITLKTPFHIFTFSLTSSTSNTSSHQQHHQQQIQLQHQQTKQKLQQQQQHFQQQIVNIHLSTINPIIKLWSDAFHASKEHQAYLRYIKKSKNSRNDLISSSSGLQFHMEGV